MLRVWEYGGRASKGLAQVAKWGSPRVLESELKAESQHIRTIIKARGLWYPNVNGKTFAVFRTDKKNHLVSLVSFWKTTKFMTVVKPQQLEFLYFSKKQKCHFCNIKLCKF